MFDWLKSEWRFVNIFIELQSILYSQNFQSCYLNMLRIIFLFSCYSKIGFSSFSRFVEKKLTQLWNGTKMEHIFGFNKKNPKIIFSMFAKQK